MNKIGKDGNQRDRALGEFWEDEFIKMARGYEWEAWAFNRVKGGYFLDGAGNSYISPDVWILRRGEQQYICEIKHKNLAQNNCYGFESYREDSMLRIEANYSNQFGRVQALYAVHNHDMAGGKWAKQNNILHWHAQLLQELSEAGHEGQPVYTYYNGEKSDAPVPIKYYPYRCFRPLPYFLELAL